MRCSHCPSTATTGHQDRAAHGYRRFHCGECLRGFNERTGSMLNRLQLPTDVVFLIVLWRLRLKLSLRDLAESLQPLGHCLRPIGAQGAAGDQVALEVEGVADGGMQRNEALVGTR